MGLQVAAAGKIINEFTGLAFAGGEFETDNPAIRFVSAEAWTRDAQGAHIVFATAPIGSSSPVEGMRLTSEGVLLVGTDTASGSAKLQVSGAISVSGITYAGTLALSATGANVITLSTNGSERARVSSAGNILVGTATDDGANKLQVFGNAILSSAGTTSLFLKADNAYAWNIQATTGSADLEIIRGTDTYGSIGWGNGTFTWYNQTPTTGSTGVLFKGGAGQSTNAIFDVQANAGTSVFKVLETKIGFFGATPVVKQTVTADAASILAALQAYGLAV